MPKFSYHLDPLTPDLISYESPLKDAIVQAISDRDTNTLPLLQLPHRTDDLETLAPHIEKFRRFKSVVILGTGGSSLGGKTIYSLADQSIGFNPKGPQLYFFDNVDPATFDAFFTHADPKTTGVIVISKSGTTAETLSQFVMFLDAFKNEKAADHFLAITEPGKRPLRDICEGLHIPVLDHDPNVGGRFSVLSLVGLLPILIAGLDGAAVRKGAYRVLETSFNARTDPLSCPAAKGAALNVAFGREKNIHQTVLMPYIDNLFYFTFWYRQLWAESVGKQGKGSTPINAIGTVDQHSQLQLYLDGPKDKFFTLIFKKTKGQGQHMTADHPALNYLNGRTMGDLLDAEQRATLETLIKNHCPVRLISIDALNEETLGALLMHFMLETIYAAHLLGVNAFDQPAVEQGKILTREFLSAIKPQ